MALIVSSRGRSEQLKLQARLNKCEDRQVSPERTKVSTEPNSKLGRSAIVPVIYYLSRNGQLDHPHFMAVPVSSSQGLFLTDVINRLNFLRGKGMANRYSWSAKRSYKNGYVWHDLEEKDFIYPMRGQEYVLKGSEILEASTNLTSKLSKTASSSTSSSVKQPEITVRSEGVKLRNRQRNQSWSSMEETPVDDAVFNTSTQTQTKEKLDCTSREIKKEQSTELSGGEISPPPSDSSPETLESLMNLDGKLALSSSSSIQDTNPMATEHLASAGKIKPSSILMSLISCGSTSFRDLGAPPPSSLISQYKPSIGLDPTVEKAPNLHD